MKIQAYIEQEGSQAAKVATRLTTQVGGTTRSTTEIGNTTRLITKKGGTAKLMNGLDNGKEEARFEERFGRLLEARLKEDDFTGQPQPKVLVRMNLQI